MKYTVVIEKPAEKFIVRLAQPEKERVLRAIHELPHSGDIKRLQGKKSRGMYRLRVGPYRIIYTVDNGQLVVRVIDAGTVGRFTTDTKARGRRQNCLRPFCCHSAP